jgi:penicillin amidase
MNQKIVLTILVAVILLISYAVSPFMPYLNPSSGLWKHCLSVDYPVLEEIDVPGLQEDIRIERDNHGIPHIYAETDLDLFFALGYIHAQDRLFQMDLNRRLPSGRLSEIVGEAAYESDTFYRTLGMHRAAQKTYEKMSQWTKDILDSYCKGVNHYIDTTSMYPVEYTLLQCEPAEWTPVDSLVFGKMMGWELSGNFYDLEFQKLEEAFGPDVVEELFPSHKPLEVPIIPDLSEACTEILQWSNQTLKIPVELGSNNWAVAPEKSWMLKAFLCNDPHLSTTIPAIWYQAHLVSPTYDVAGVTFPGAPCIVIGRNRHIAWGLTNTGADVIDFYVETFSGDQTQYLFEGEWYKTEFVEEKIFIQGADPRTITVKMTRHGPVLERDNKEFAVCWTGLDPTFEFEALLLINKAKSYEEYTEGLRLFSVPAQNFAYTDIDGNIAMRSNGKIPIRKEGMGRIPVDGASGDYEWIGYIPFEELPHSFNPEQGYLVSANQIPAGDEYPYYLGFLWADRYRAQRINDLLKEKETFVIEDMMKIQSDLYDIPASVLTPLIVDTVSPQTPLEEEALEYLKSWNYYDERTQIAPTIFHTVLEKIKENTFKDEYEKAGVPDSSYPSTETLETMLRDGSKTNFFDISSTVEEEPKEYIIQKSFSEAVSELQELLGNDVTQWYYGRKHMYSLEHLIGSVVEALNYPAFGYDGSSYTVDVSGGWVSKHGPSWRQITNLQVGFCIYPGGQSGNPFSEHYTDFVELWKESQYIEWLFEGYELESVLIMRRV